MPELILIVIIATFIAGLSFCDREEKRSIYEVLSKRYFDAMNSFHPVTPMSREDLEKIYPTRREPVIFVDGFIVTNNTIEYMEFSEPGNVDKWI